MRTAPALTVDIPVSTGWRVGVFGLTTLAASVFLGWLVGPRPGVSEAAFMGAAVGGVLCLGIAVRAAFPGSCRLHWDGVNWAVGEFGADHDMLLTGRVRVMLDLSFAMLLRFEAEPFTRGTARWIPVGCRDVGTAWPALRLTVYSAPQPPHTAWTRPVPHE